MVWIKGELKCLNCSRFLGEVMGPDEHHLGRDLESRWAPEAPVLRSGPASFRCGRCGGRAVVEAWERVIHPSRRRLAA